MSFDQVFSLFRVIVWIIAAVQAKKSSSSSSSSESSEYTAEWDYIVVGSGSSGGTAASLLAQAKYDVLLLEAGPDDAAFSCQSCTLDGQDFIAGIRTLPAMYINLQQTNVQIYNKHTIGTTQLPDSIFLQLGIPDLVWPAESGEAYVFERPQSGFSNKRATDLNRAKMLGGCSSHNLLTWNRGSIEDFDYVEQVLGVKNWGYDDVLPYFKQIETFYGDDNDNSRGDNGPISVRPRQFIDGKMEALINAAQDAGFLLNTNYNGLNQSGVSVLEHNLGKYDRNNGENGVYNTSYYRSGVSEEYIRNTINSNEYGNYLTVRTKCEVTKILFDDNKNAIGVEYFDYNENKYVNEYVKKEVILSAGTYQSPKILMVSGVGPSDQLEKFNIDPVYRSEKIGKNLQNHLYSSVLFETKDELNYDALNMDSLSFIFPRVDDISATAVQIFASTNDYYRLGFNYNDIRIECWSDGYAFGDYYNYTSINTLLDGTQIDGISLNYLSQAGNIRGNAAKGVGCFIDPQIYSNSGRVELASNNSFDYPLVFPNYLSDMRDIEQHIKGIKIARNIFSQDEESFVKEILPGPFINTDEELREYIYRTTADSSHPVGTLSMGSGKNDVVDNKCKLRGVNNLRIVDSSIWPVPTNGGNNAVAIMIGAKCADHIID